MENITLLNSILVIAGVVIHIAMSMKSEVYQGKQEFDFKYFWVRNRIDLFVGLITGFVSLLLAEPLIEMLGLYAGDQASFFQFHAFLSGVLGRAWIFSLIHKLKVNQKLQENERN